MQVGRGATLRNFTVSPIRRWWEGEEVNSAWQSDEPNSRVPEAEQDTMFSRKEDKIDLPRRIHILGMGNVGTFVAHSLAGIPNPPPLRLLLKDHKYTKAWKEANYSLKLTTHGVTETRTGFEAEINPTVLPDEKSSIFDESPSSAQGVDPPVERLDGVFKPASDDSIIYNMIVTTKAPATALALRPYAHRLTPTSTILFLQNGMGVIDEVNALVFPDPKGRPQFMIGVNSHGLKRRAQDQFDVVHAGEGTIALGIMPQLLTPESEPIQTLMGAPPSARYLLRTMTRTPIFVAVGFAPTALFQQQLDKLAVNAIINPLTAILDIKNGGIVANFYFKRVMRLLLAEISLVFRSLPELENVPNVNTRFDPLRLEYIVLSIAETTHSNDSSMLQDMRAVRQTEIDYINGYIVKRGEELGVHCVLNYMLVHMIKGKCLILDRRERDIDPFTTTLSRFEGEENP